MAIISFFSPSRFILASLSFSFYSFRLARVIK